MGWGGSPPPVKPVTESKPSANKTSAYERGQRCISDLKK